MHIYISSEDFEIYKIISVQSHWSQYAFKLINMLVNMIINLWKMNDSIKQFIKNCKNGIYSSYKIFMCAWIYLQQLINIISQLWSMTWNEI